MLYNVVRIVNTEKHNVMLWFLLLWFCRGGQRRSSMWCLMLATPTQSLVYKLSWLKLLRNTNICDSETSHEVKHSNSFLCMFGHMNMPLDVTSVKTCNFPKF